MGHRKKRRTHVKTEERPSENKSQHPKSIVMRRGKLGALLMDLEKDLRKVMEPNTASALKESRKNALKDFVSVAGPLGVTHLLILSATEAQSYLRIATIPRGPTLTLGIREYTLTSDIASSQKNYSAPPAIFKTPPLVVLNNFVGEKQLRLAAVVCQNMFPSINVRAVKLASCRRVVLLDYDQEEQAIHFRHYHITAQAAGVSKRLQRVAVRGAVPDMHNLGDIADYLGGAPSDSEGEETAARVTLPQDLSRSALASSQSKLKLRELGPRMLLDLVKLEEGICTGQVLYHKYVHKSAEEQAEGRAKREAVEAAELERKERREEQARRVEEKMAKKEEARQQERARQGCRDIAGTRRGARGAEVNESDADTDEGEGEDQEHVDVDESDEDGNKGGEEKENQDEDSDNEWYRQEVGEEPDDNFKKNVKARKAKQELQAQMKKEKKLQKEKDRKEASKNKRPNSANTEGNEQARGKSRFDKKRKLVGEDQKPDSKKPKTKPRGPNFR